MLIKMDINEFTLHPQIVQSIELFLAKKKQISKGETLIKLYEENKVIPQHLECGDYMFNNVLIEHKALSDFCGAVTNDLIFQQAQDMLYFKEKFPDVKLYILISGNLEDIPKLEHSPSVDSMIAAWASLNTMISTSFVSNSYFFARGMVNLFEKHYDGKVREYNPIRKPQEFDDIILSNYCSLVGEETAKNLIKKFPYPKLLYNASAEQLREVDGIGKEISEFIVNVSEGREKSWKVLEEKKKLKKEQKRVAKEQKKHIDIDIPISI